MKPWKNNVSEGEAKDALAHVNRLLLPDGQGGNEVAHPGDFRRIDTFLGIVAAAYSFPETIHEEERERITKGVVYEARIQGELVLEHVASRIGDKIKSYKGIRPKKFVILTSASIRHFPGLTPVRPSGAVITFSSARPSKFEIPEPLKKLGTVWQAAPMHYTVVKVHVLAKGPTEAVSEGLRQVDYIRALWNFFRGYGRVRMSFAGVDTGPKPPNDIILGPVHTVHDVAGKVAENTYWYDLNSTQRVEPVNLGKSFRKMREFEQSVRRNMKKCPFERTMVGLFIRYARALDERDFSSAFLRLWSILEDLTSTSGTTYDVTVKRAAFLFKDQREHRMILNHLRTWRNRIVHDGDQAHDSERILYQLKHYVEVLLYLIIRSPDTFQSLEEVGDFLGLTRQREWLSRRIRQLELASKMATYG